MQRHALAPSAPRRVLLLAAALLSATALLPGTIRAQGTPIGFVEEFALAEDRAATLAQLIPGTEQHFYYSCLLAEHERRWADQDQLLAQWIERYGRTAEVVRLENRRAVLRWSEQPEESAKLLRQRLGLSFQHQREVAGVDPQLPTRLDPALIAPGQLAERALRLHRDTLDGFRDSALRSLAAGPLTDGRLNSLLQRLTTPDVPNLPALVVRQLLLPRSGKFGTLRIHRELLLDQLDECARLLPQLVDDPDFVGEYLERLQPGPDVPWKRDAAARESYLDRLETFTRRLAPAHNSLKAHVLYHRLQHDLAQGTPNEARFKEYLRLPRQAGYVNARYLERLPSPDRLADLGRNYPTGLDRVGNDEALVRAYFEHFFVEAGSFDGYREQVDPDWLRRVFAETKILNGVGDMQQWYALLDDPGYYERLRDRVEIRFAPISREYYAVGERVVLDVDVKNVETLLVKVFEIHTVNYHRDLGREIDASIELDGLVANEERTVRIEEGPLRRVRRQLEFPSIDRPGVWVLELIGNGISSRALVRMGHLGYLERIGSAGHVLRVLDERGSQVRGASVLIGGREFASDEDGEILIPFSTDPGTKPILLRSGEFSVLDRLEHRGENYALRAGIHVERETLLPGRRAAILVRPSLVLGNQPIAASLLEDVRLTITATDQDGIATSLDVPGLRLDENGEVVHEIQVPEGLRQLSIGLRGKIASVISGSPVELATAVKTFDLNAIDATPKTHAALLGHTAAGYVLDLLGKDGEPKAGRAVTLRLSHRDFADWVTITLRTDERGRIELGSLDGIVSVRTDEQASSGLGWTLPDAERTFPSRLHGVEGSALLVPWPSAWGTLDRSNAGLLEMRGAAPLRDAFDRLEVVDGYLRLGGLSAGDYRLRLGREGHQVLVRVLPGRRDRGWILGTERRLQTATGGTLQVAGLEADENELRIRLAGANRAARVHVTASRYLPPYPAFANLELPAPPVARIEFLTHPESSYHSGRSIGDEYRYILDRRFAAKYPGNMLSRPGLILNPWALEEIESSLGQGGASGGRFGGRGGRASGGSNGPNSPRPDGRFEPPGTGPNLAFLPEGAHWVTNLRPDGDGLVRVPRSALGEGQLVQVVALDATDTVFATLPLAERPLEPAPRHLSRALDPALRLTEQRRIDFVAPGGEAVIDDVRSAELETYDSLAAVYRLFRTISESPDLDRFAFVLRWPQIERAERLALYAEHACHELHFFLYSKDRAFFDEVVRPYLANKAYRTFLDDWLLENDLRPYLAPWAFERLNTVERILLAQRLQSERASVARSIRDALALVPPDTQREEQLFRRALRGDALAAGEEDAFEGGDFLFAPAEKAMPPGAPSGPATPGQGGGRGPARNADRSAGEPKKALEAEQLEEEVLEVEGEMQDARDKDEAKRKEVRRFYRAPDTTQRYVEHNYWHLRIEEQLADLIQPNAFWLAYAERDPSAPFASPRFVEAARSFAEMIFALSVLDLPFEAEAPEIARDGGRVNIRPKSPLLLVRKELAEAEAPSSDQAPILVSQNFFRLDERFVFDGNERRDNYVTDEFLVDVAYACQVVVTNPSSTPRRLELLLQIPDGAIPVQNGFFTRGRQIRLDSYATEAIEYAFYFPAPGQRSHYPVQVTQEGRTLASAPPMRLAVVAEPSRVDTASWAHVSQNGTLPELLAFLDQNNLGRLDLDKIAWRLKQRESYDAILSRLEARHDYHPTSWSYALEHRDPARLREYLRHADGFLAACGSALDADLVSIDPIERHAYQHVEFEPLFNGRAHRFGSQLEILNAGVARQYLELLDILAHRARLSDLDRLSVTYYLLLQDRVGEALAAFARVEPARLPTRIQYDYMRAYLGFYDGDHETSRRLAERHRNHPVERWRARFTEVLDQLDEAQGKLVSQRESDDRTRQQTDLARTEPALELVLEGKRMLLRHENLERVKVRYFLMDVEFLFSTHPFVEQGTSSFSYVRPNRTDEIELAAQETQRTLELPSDLEGRNVLIEVEGGGLVRRQTFYANSLAVRWIETYGQLQVSEAESGGLLPKVYVKVYARTPNGSVRFHKDGYTDLRGRFDYASLSGTGAANVDRYSILVLSEDHGAVIREVEPPPR